MFPEIVRDEVFRLETRRLWLRWPMVADAFDAPKTDTGATAQPEPMAAIGLVSEQGACLPSRSCVTHWRDANERGEALHLTLETKEDRTTAGMLHLAIADSRNVSLNVRLGPTFRDEDLVTEAVQAAVHMVFLLGVARTIVAHPSADDARGRAMLERCGFSDAGTDVSVALGETDAVSSDLLRTETWVRVSAGESSPIGRRWPVPALALHRAPVASACVAHGCW